MNKLNIALVAGGFTDEYVISLESAKLFIAHLSVQKYNVYQLFLNKDGWKAKGPNGESIQVNKSDFTLETDSGTVQIDAVINTIHGTPGEDGKLQGYFELLGIRYMGCGVLSSALTFNKGFCNHFLAQQKVLVPNSVILYEGQSYDESVLIDQLKLPCFVKPNDAGSSLGVSKVKSKEQLTPAITEAFKIADKVLVESFVDGVEITCGVIQRNGKPEPVAVTEIVFESEFFDYDAKYQSNATQEITPARIDQKDYDYCMKVSAEIYQRLGCKGLFRADYILQDGQLFLIEVNTIPGMSAKSLLPQQLAYKGINLADILDESINQLIN